MHRVCAVSGSEYVSAGDADQRSHILRAATEMPGELCAFHLPLSLFFSSLSSLPGHLLDALSDRIPDTELVLKLIVLASQSDQRYRRPVLSSPLTLCALACVCHGRLSFFLPLRFFRYVS